MGPLKINLKFLEHHKDQYLELHRELKQSNVAPQSEAALQNFKTQTQLELEISSLMGCNIQWAEPSDFAAPEAAATSLLGAAATADYNMIQLKREEVGVKEEVGAQPQAPHEVSSPRETHGHEHMTSHM